MISHTPGPWAYRIDQYEANRTVIGAVVGDRTNWLMSILHNGELMPQKQEADVRLLSASPKLLAALREALRIEKARLVLADGLDEQGNPYTKAQKLDAKAFLSSRSANWLHEAVDAIVSATGESS